MNLFVRQEHLIPRDKVEQQKVHVIGCGATGSNIAYLLAKTGVKIIVYDFDDVEPKNVLTQCFRTADIGKNKAFALLERVYEDFGEQLTNIEAVEMKVTGDMARMFDGIVILAVDSIEARYDIGSNLNCELIIAPGIPAHISDDALMLSTGTVQVFKDLEVFREKYLPVYKDRTDKDAEQTLREQLSDWGKGCDKQAYSILCLEVALTCAKIVMTYIIGNPEFIVDSRYDISGALPYIKAQKYV